MGSMQSMGAKLFALPLLLLTFLIVFRKSSGKATGSEKATYQRMSD